jgi:hypothetical protein
VVESSSKWPESGLVVQMPCSPVTLCRDLRTASGLLSKHTVLLMSFKLSAKSSRFESNGRKR